MLEKIREMAAALKSSDRAEAIASEGAELPRDERDTSIKIEVNGVEKTVTFDQFPAIDGYEIEQDFDHYLMSDNKATERGYMLRVLSFASVEGSRLDSEEAVNTLLGRHQNLEVVFLGTLAANGINPEREKAARAEAWAKCGEDLGKAAVKTAIELMQPLFESMIEKSEGGE